MPPADAGLEPSSGDLASPRRWLVAALVLVGLGAIPFFAATTFVGDDHLFLAFARYEDRPLRAFIADVHGGEFYRPVPMLLWWLIARAASSGGALPTSTWPFAALGFVLHLTVAALAGVVLWAVRFGRAPRHAWRSPAVAAACFFLAPLPREAAYWYAASTDLLAAAFGIAAVLAVLLDSRMVAAMALAIACGCKETALVFPLLAIVALRAQGGAWPLVWRRAWPMIPVALLHGLARTMVLGGLGGSGDVAASVPDKGLQIAAGLVHLFPGNDVLPEPFATLVGVLAWLTLAVAWLVRTRARLPSRRQSPAWMWMWIALSVAPLLAAPWIVGARYFYLAAVGGCFLVAEALARFSWRASIGALLGLAALSGAQAIARHADVASYDARLAAVRMVITAGVARGARVFHVSAGIKDLDLAVKEDFALKAHASSLLILGDVPASFVVAPDSPPLDLAFLLAHPALPPSGAYHFGARRIVGLARRGDDPTLDEVLTHFPGLRLIRPRIPATGNQPVSYRDVTEELLGDPRK
jgi:hypothetical protein